MHNLGPASCAYLMQLVAAGVALLAAVLYDSADIGSAEQVAAHLPASLDDRLKVLMSNVSLGRCPPPAVIQPGVLAATR